uniref:Uncharacterized protein n=1 Tax=Mimiviridae sp. ChoanoV1 TaxID=2596887 RepID=A0A5B8IFX0_9VIRU|nr:hypothetical protein 2_19 [Mimiviridae sp. ChoanoV1]
MKKYTKKEYTKKEYTKKKYNKIKKKCSKKHTRINKKNNKKNNKKLKILKGGEKEDYLSNVYSKSELKEKVNRLKKSEIIQLIPLMSGMKKNLLRQLETFDKLNKLLGNYFSK